MIRYLRTLLIGGMVVCCVSIAESQETKKRLLNTDWLKFGKKQHIVDDPFLQHGLEEQRRMAAELSGTVDGQKQAILTAPNPAQTPPANIPVANRAYPWPAPVDSHDRPILSTTESPQQQNFDPATYGGPAAFAPRTMPATSASGQSNYPATGRPQITQRTNGDAKTVHSNQSQASKVSTGPDSSTEAAQVPGRLPENIPAQLLTDSKSVSSMAPDASNQSNNPPNSAFANSGFFDPEHKPNYDDAFLPPGGRESSRRNWSSTNFVATTGAANGTTNAANAIAAQSSSGQVRQVNHEESIYSSRNHTNHPATATTDATQPAAGTANRSIYASERIASLEASIPSTATQNSRRTWQPGTTSKFQGRTQDNAPVTSQTVATPLTNTAPSSTTSPVIPAAKTPSSMVVIPTGPVSTAANPSSTAPATTIANTSIDQSSVRPASITTPTNPSASTNLPDSNQSAFEAAPVPSTAPSNDRSSAFDFGGTPTTSYNDQATYSPAEVSANGPNSEPNNQSIPPVGQPRSYVGEDSFSTAEIEQDIWGPTLRQQVPGKVANDRPAAGPGTATPPAMNSGTNPIAPEDRANVPEVRTSIGKLKPFQERDKDGAPIWGTPDLPLPDGAVGEVDPMSQVMAVVGDQSILAGDLLWQINMSLEQHIGKAPESEIAKARQLMMRQLLPRMIENKLVYMDFLRTVPPDRLPELEEKVAEEFYKTKVPELVKIAKVDSAVELDKHLRKSGSSLLKQQAIFKEQILGQQMVQQNVRAGKEITHEELLRYYYEHSKDYEYPARARWERLMVSWSSYPTKSAALAALRDMGNQVQQGAPFDEIARKGSDGPNAKEGGMYDWTSEGSLASDQINRVIFGIPKDTLSKIIQHQDGASIVRVCAA